MRESQKNNEHTLFLQIHGRTYWQLLSWSLGSTPQSLSLPGQGDSHTTKSQQQRQTRRFYFDAFAVFLVFSPLAGTLTCLSVAITALCGYTLAQKKALLTKSGFPGICIVVPWVCTLMFRPASLCSGLTHTYAQACSCHVFLDVLRT